MPKLTLMFDDRELQDCAVGTHPVTIGRLPDNTIVIDNPAVSGRHARVFREGNHFVVEDLKSTNGTFVNEKPIVRHTLLDRDVVLVGKHSLVFSQVGGEQPEMAEAAPFVPDVGGTMMLDTIRQKNLLAVMVRRLVTNTHGYPETSWRESSGLPLITIYEMPPIAVITL